MNTIQPYIELIEKLQLPIPDEFSIRETTEEGFLTPVSRYGFTLRGYKYTPCNAHNTKCGVISLKHFFSDAVLQPLGTLQTEMNGDYQHVLQIFPGLPGTLYEFAFAQAKTTDPKSIIEMNKLQVRQTLRKDGYDFRDEQALNIGRLPKPADTQFTVLDIGCVSLSENFRELKNKPYTEETLEQAAPVQFQLYKEIREAFAQNENDPSRFLNTCQQAKSNGLLANGWEQISASDFAKPENREPPIVAATNYDRILQQTAHQPIAACA